MQWLLIKVINLPRYLILSLLATGLYRHWMSHCWLYSCFNRRQHPNWAQSVCSSGRETDKIASWSVVVTIPSRT